MAQDNLLLRQVHPNHIDNGIPGSIAFRPGSGDGDRLSVDCSNMTDAESSYNLHLEKGLRSGGTWAISRTICEMEGLPVIPDAMSAPYGALHAGYCPRSALSRGQ